MAGTLSATVTVSLIGSAAAPFIGEGTLSAIVPYAETTATLAGAGALSATATPRYLIPAALAGAGSLAAAASPQFAAAAALAGGGALSAAAYPQTAAAPALAGSGTLSATAALAAPSFDTVGTGAAPASQQSTLTWTHTATAGADVYVMLGTSLRTNNAFVSSVKYGTATMTMVDWIAGAASQTLFLYRLTAAPGGAQTITATFTSANNNIGQSVSATNVTSISTAQKVSGNNGPASQSVTCGASQLIIQGFSVAQAPSGWTTTGGTNDWAGRAANGPEGLTMNHATATTTFTGNNTSYWNGIAIILS